jgi:thioredoxin 1
MNVAYYFYSDSCPPCVALKPVISDLKEEFPQVAWVSINTKEDTEGFAKRFGVSMTPTIVVVQSSGTTEKHTGTSPIGYYRMFRNATR